MRKFLVIYFLTILASLAAGLLIGNKFNFIKTQPICKVSQGIRFGQTGLTNPLLACADDQGINTKEILSFKNLIKEAVDNKLESGKVLELAVYFRDLNDGPWFMINGSQKFYPASLVKLPLMIAYLKKSEIDPGILSKQINFDLNSPDLNTLQYYHPDGFIEPGKSYLALDLINKMITLSDNNAQELLKNNIDPETFSKVYTDIGLQYPNFIDPDNSDSESVKDYASFFRVLYNSSYLSWDNSQKALDILTRVEFKDGLVAGVPKSLKVAHKFGIRSKDIIKQMHDCGIVYYPTNPYIVCIMSKGYNFDQLQSAISDISKQIYIQIDQQLGKHPS